MYRNKCRVLIVDDYEPMRDTMRSLLTVHGDIEVIGEAVNGNEAIQMVAACRTDVILMDLVMPEMDGISFLAEVKKKFPLVPRVLLTGYADKENAIKAINNVGLYQYIEKPWNNDDLRLIIRNGLEKTILLKQLEEKVREVEKVHKELNDVQKEILRVFV